MAAKPLRYLTIEHAENAKLERSPNIVLKQQAQNHEPQLEPLLDGHQKLYSFFQPGLSGGTHEINVVQTISATKDGKKQDLGQKPSQKIFTVESPRYSLPEGCVHSANPAEGEKAPAEMLPSVVFSDPHLPWERTIPFHEGMKEDREAMPWVALLVFDQDEVHIAAEHMSGPSCIFAGIDIFKTAHPEGQPEKPIPQSSTSAITMSLSDLNKVKTNNAGIIASPVPVDNKDDTKTMLDVVFVRPKTFNQLAATFENGAPKVGQTETDLSRYKYLSHVRHVKTKGMATSAGTESKGLFSVVLSHRLGPLSQDQPRAAIAHLVSLEGWQGMDLAGSGAKYVALNTLYSWTYTAMPMKSFNLRRAFQHIGDNLSVLRAPEEMMTKLKKNGTPMALNLSQRMKDGFTLKKYRTQTGEPTTAFFRGPLQPSCPRHPFTPKWTSMSNSGINLQILDPDTGMLDITYSAAWNLGKSMALADAVFTTALARLRKLVFAPALNSGKKNELRNLGAFVSKTETLSTIADSLTTLKALANKSESGVPQPPAEQRWKMNAASKVVDLALSNVSVNTTVKNASIRKARKLAGSLATGDEEPEFASELFNELNKPFSSDWMIVLSWVLDRMFLFGIPPQYLIVDQKFLPQESMKFFYIDPNWIDSLIDGALSLANTIDQDDDFIRRAIKSAINVYLNKDDVQTGFRPQIPSYGLFFRSDIISQYPDIKIEAPFPKGSDFKGTPILRHTIISEGLLLCLFDRAPGKAELSELKFTQPPHQQTFAVGAEIQEDQLAIQYKKAYSVTQSTTDLDYSGFADRTVFRDGHEGPKLFFWGENDEARMLVMDAWAKDVLDALTGPKGMPPTQFKDDLTTSALVGVQLGTPIYQLAIQASQTEATKQPAVAAPTRELAMLGAVVPALEMVPVRAARMQMQMRAQSVFEVPNLLGIEIMDRAPHLPAFSAVESIESRPVAEIGGSEQVGFYEYMIGPIDADIKKCGELSYTGKPEDLVFSILRKPRENDSMYPPWFLLEILITVKFGKPISLPNVASNLMPGYDGPGPSMLSNMRYNVLAERNDSELQLRIVSRSARGGSIQDQVRDCSFLLPLVEVHKLSADKNIKIEFEESYALRDDAKPDEPTPLNPIKDKFYVTLLGVAS